MSVSAEEIKVLLTADASQLQEGMAQAAAATTSAVQAQMAAFGELDSLLEGHTATIEQLMAQEQALDTLQQAGLVSTEELAEAFNALDAAEAALVGSTEAVAAAQAESNAAMSLSGGTARELGVMLGELARGNYTRLEGSTITLANRTGVLQTALAAVLSPLGLLVAAAAAVGYSIFEAGQEFQAMEGTVLATGDASGYTAGQLVGMADKIGQSTGSISTATEAVQKLAESGRFAGQDLQLVAQAAAEMSALTGESIQSCVAQIEKLQEDPVKAVAKLNDQFHFLTVSQFQQMESLQQAGDVMGAASIAYQAMADKMEGRTDTLNEHVNVLVANFRKLKTAWSEGMQELDADLGGGDDSERLNIQVRMLNNLKEQDAEAQKMGSGALPEITAELQHQTEVVNQMTAQFHGQAQAAANVGAAAQKSAQQIDEMAKSFKSGGGDRTAAEQDKQDLEEMQVARTVSLGEEKAYWENIATSAQQGSAEYRQAIQQLIEIKNKQAEAAKEAARKGVEAQKQEDAAILDGLQEERAATQENTAARIQADNTVLQSAIQMYGMRSSQAKSALNQMLSDEKSYDASVEAEQQKSIADQEKILETSVKGQEDADQQKIKSIENQYRLGELNAREFVDAEKAANQEALDDFAQYTSKKIALDQGNVKALEADAKEWVTTSAAITSQLTQEQQQAAQKTQQQWTQASNQITRSLDSALNTMLFSTQSHTQQMQNLYRMLGQEVIKLAVEQPLENWIRGEVQKTAATVAGVAQRNAAQSAGAAAGMAESAAMSQKQIMNAAYTAAANTYESVSSIPVVGWILAPAAAAATFAGVEAFDNVASAAGGWGNVDADQLAQIHKNEMILPAHIADFVRSGAQAQSGTAGTSRGGGDIHNWNINAMDGKSVARVLSSNPDAIRKAASRAMNPGGRRRR